MISCAVIVVQRINVLDVSEIRPGSHSLGFVKTGSTEFDTEVSDGFSLCFTSFPLSG